MTVGPPPAHVLSAGTPTGPCVVFVHGLEDGWQAWRRLAGCLGPGWRAVALELPWRAGNDYRWRWAGTPAAWVGAGLAEAAGDRPCLVVGHSFGANAVLARLAAGEPRATAAVLAAPLFRPAAAAVTWRTFDLCRERFERQLGDGLRARLGRPQQPDVFALMLSRVCDRIGPVGFLTVFEEYVSSGHLALSEIDLPVMVLAGDADPGIHRPHLDTLGQLLPRGTVVCGPELDHFCHLSQAPRVARAIEQLAGVAGGNGA